VLGFDADTIDVHFVEGVFSVSKMFDSVRAEAQDIGDFGAVVVDTAAAYFEGDAENDNVQAGNYARQLRKFSDLPGNPGVIVGAHPIKSGEVLLPRGGGAFLNEMDGNLTAKKVSDEIVELHWLGKYRGANFDPVLFKLVPIKSERVRDAKGRLIPTIMAQLTDGKTLDVLADEVASDQEQVLLLHDYTPGITVREVADKLGWKSDHGHNTAKVSRILNDLKGHGLMTKDLRGRHSLTKRGKDEAGRLRNRT
jgi:hypothetical protein